MRLGGLRCLRHLPRWCSSPNPQGSSAQAKGPSLSKELGLSPPSGEVCANLAHCARRGLHPYLSHSCSSYMAGEAARPKDTGEGDFSSPAWDAGADRGVASCASSSRGAGKPWRSKQPARRRLESWQAASRGQPRCRRRVFEVPTYTTTTTRATRNYAENDCNVDVIDGKFNVAG